MTTDAIEEAARLSEALGKIWGAATAASRAKGGLPVLSPSQARALRLVSRKGATTPAELAADLGLSRSLVSELVRKLEETDLITRTKSATDGRSVTLSPSERGAYVQRHYRLGLFDAFSEALGALPHAEARLILAALPALDSLRRQMETIAGREEEAAKASTM